ncbi:MAG: cupin [Chloroflexi bacterium HGW-Chloroflexi-9]|nr:MAG: cupin [Chloroflexi bacterium HGW-Chloroflexi-9]
MTTEHPSTYARTHELQADVLPFVLGPEVDAVLKHARAASDGHAAKTLVKDGPLRVTLVGLRAGAQLEEHEVAGPVLVQGLSGVARLMASEHEVDLGPGALVALNLGVAHVVQAVQDCAFLITIALTPVAEESPRQEAQ